MMFNAANFLTRIYLLYCRKVFNHPAKIRIAYLFHRIFKNQIKVIGYNGSVLQLTPSDYITGNIVFKGSYEDLSIKLAIELLHMTKGDFLDVGANIGLYTCIISKNFPAIKVISLEPEEGNFTTLLKNIKLNGSNVIALNIAAGKRPGFVKLEKPLENNNGTFRVSIEENRTIDSKYIAMMDIKIVLQVLKIDQISLMKIDIEGYEMQALMGLDWLNINKPRNILMEFSDYVSRTGSSTDEVLNFLSEKGYKSYTVTKKPYLMGDHLPEDNLWLTLAH